MLKMRNVERFFLGLAKLVKKVRQEVKFLEKFEKVSFILRYIALYLYLILPCPPF